MVVLVIFYLRKTASFGTFGQFLHFCLQINYASIQIDWMMLSLGFPTFSTDSLGAAKLAEYC